MLANADELRGVARSLRSTRSTIDADHAALQSAGAIFSGSWRGPAADDVRTTLFQICLNSMGCVTRDLDELAGMLDRAADELTAKIVKIKSIEKNARYWFAHQPAPPAGTLSRWEREWWQYRPGRLPASGDSAWIAAGAYLRALGVTV